MYSENALINQCKDSEIMLANGEAGALSGFNEQSRFGPIRKSRKAFVLN